MGENNTKKFMSVLTCGRVLHTGFLLTKVNRGSAALAYLVGQTTYAKRLQETGLPPNSNNLVTRKTTQLEVPKTYLFSCEKLSFYILTSTYFCFLSLTSTSCGLLSTELSPKQPLRTLCRSLSGNMLWKTPLLLWSLL